MIRSIASDEAALLVPLCEVVQDLHRQHRPDIFTPPAADGDVIAYFKDWMNRPGVTVLLAEQGGLAVGYLLFEVQERPGTALSQPMQRGFLQHIAVLPDWQRQGIGRALIARMKDLLRQEGVGRWATSYWCFNAASAALMEQAGATPAYIVADAPL